MHYFKFFLHKLPALQDLLECNTNNKEINITIPYYTITTNLLLIILIEARTQGTTLNAGM